MFYLFERLRFHTTVTACEIGNQVQQGILINSSIEMDCEDIPPPPPPPPTPTSAMQPTVLDPSRCRRLGVTSTARPYRQRKTANSSTSTPCLTYRILPLTRRSRTFSRTLGR